MTIHEATQQLLFQLLHIYEEREARNIVDLVMEEVSGWKRIDRVVNKGVPLAAESERLLFAYTEQLLEHKPVQYVLNRAWFCGVPLYVDENVLIPRPETEELVNWLVEDMVKLRTSEKKDEGSANTYSTMRILDVGTGSGCIAVALKKKLPIAHIYACDLSEKALAVASRNAKESDVAIDFLLCDFLYPQKREVLPEVEVIVSNPPYIPLKSKDTIAPNVLQYEPALALFVQDDDPLCFYRAIANHAGRKLTGDGSLYVEIEEDSSQAVMELFARHGFKHIELRKDMQGKDRMVKAGRYEL